MFGLIRILGYFAYRASLDTLAPCKFCHMFGESQAHHIAKRNVDIVAFGPEQLRGNR
jgi:hypothetical protein